MSSVSFEKYSGKVEVEFSKALMPYLLELKSKFTRYQIKNILYLKNKHSIRLYELLKQYEVIRQRSFTVVTLKEILALENQYAVFSEFDRNVIRPSIREINKYTDINVDYEKLKKGRSVYLIKFIITPLIIKSKLKDYDIIRMKNEMGVQEENFDDEQIMTLYETSVIMMGNIYNNEMDIYNYININYQYMLQRDNVMNDYSYLLNALKNDTAKARAYIKASNKLIWQIALYGL